MAHEHRTERPARRGRVDDTGGDAEGGQEALLPPDRCWPRRRRLPEPDPARRAGPSSRATTTSPRSTGSCSTRHHEGLIVTTGCLGGHVLQALLHGDERGALREGGSTAGHLRPRQPLRRAAGPRHPRRSTAPTRSCSRSPSKLRAPLLATNDSHYTHRDDAVAHDALLCVQTGVADERPRPLQVPRRRALPEDRGRDAPPVPRGARGVRQHAVDRRAGRCRDRVRQAAAAELPAARGLRRRRRLPAHLTFAGRQASAGATRSPTTTVERLAFELQVIADMGFSSYFLIVWDLIRHARDNEHPGRARAAAARPAARWPTACDHRPRPIKYDLLFERFLNPSRISMPDIDMDFDSRYRDEMIRYAAERYGRDRVAQIVTFSTIKARAAVRDAARVLGYPVRRRRQGRQGHAAAGHGPRHAAVSLPRAAPPSSRTATRWPPSCATCTTTDPDAQAGRSTWPRASRACAARTASTPPRW